MTPALRRALGWTVIALAAAVLLTGCNRHLVGSGSSGATAAVTSSAPATATTADAGTAVTPAAVAPTSGSTADPAAASSDLDAASRDLSAADGATSQAGTDLSAGVAAQSSPDDPN